MSPSLLHQVRTRRCGTQPSRRTLDAWTRGNQPTTSLSIQDFTTLHITSTKFASVSHSFSIMTLYVRNPFLGVDLISGGAGGYVSSVNDRIAVKYPKAVENPLLPQHEEDMVECAEKAAHEQEMYRILMKNPHPHILRAILLVPGAIFMERMAGTLHDRIKEPLHGRPPPPDEHERRWILQLSSAVAWLETLGLAHGDLRPRNVLLTADDDIRLADFDVTRRFGEEVYTVCAPFGKYTPGREFPIAGPDTEQFALASCIYNIRFGKEPLAEIDGPEMVKMLRRFELPPTPDDGELGQLLADCWRGKFESIAAVDEKLRTLLGAEDRVTLVEDPGRCEMLLAECQEFVNSQEGRRARLDEIIRRREELAKEGPEKGEPALSRETDALRSHHRFLAG